MVRGSAGLAYLALRVFSVFRLKGGWISGLDYEGPFRGYGVNLPGI